MQLSMINNGDTVIAAFDGELDEHTATDVRDTLDNRIASGGFRNFVFDFSRLKFMDSTGIGVLLGRYKTLKRRGAGIYISSPNPHVDKILSLAGIYSIIQKINL